MLPSKKYLFQRPIAKRHKSIAVVDVLLYKESRILNDSLFLRTQLNYTFKIVTMSLNARKSYFHHKYN